MSQDTRADFRRWPVSAQERLRRCLAVAKARRLVEAERFRFVRSRRDERAQEEFELDVVHHQTGGSQ